MEDAAHARGSVPRTETARQLPGDPRSVSLGRREGDLRAGRGPVLAAGNALVGAPGRNAHSLGAQAAGWQGDQDERGRDDASAHEVANPLRVISPHTRRCVRRVKNARSRHQTVRWR